MKVGGDWLENVTHRTSLHGRPAHPRPDVQHEPDERQLLPAGPGRQLHELLGQPCRVYFEHDYYTDALGSFNPVGSTTTAPPSQLWSAFLQDTWRITPKFTLNARRSLRHSGRSRTPPRSRRLDLDDQWQPRVGFIYDWKGDGSTKLYGSYGRFYYMIPQDLAVRVYGSQFSDHDLELLRSVLQPLRRSAAGRIDSRRGSVAPGAETANRVLFQGGSAFQPVDDNINGPYQDEFALGVEMALTPTFAVGLKGMYRNLGNTIEDRCDLDYND